MSFFDAIIITLNIIAFIGILFAVMIPFAWIFIKLKERIARKKIPEELKKEVIKNVYKKEREVADARRRYASIESNESTQREYGRGGREYGGGYAGDGDYESIEDEISRIRDRINNRTTRAIDTQRTPETQRQRSIQNESTSSTPGTKQSPKRNWEQFD